MDRHCQVNDVQKAKQNLAVGLLLNIARLESARLLKTETPALASCWFLDATFSLSTMNALHKVILPETNREAPRRPW